MVDHQKSKWFRLKNALFYCIIEKQFVSLFKKIYEKY